MAVTVTELRPDVPRFSVAQSWYLICGFPVQSGVRLLLPELGAAHPARPAWTIRLGETDRRGPVEPATVDSPGQAPGYIRGTAFTTSLDGTGSWWCFESVATVHVSTDARVVDVYPKSGADERSLSMILTGPLASFIMYRHGQPTLHSSAVATPHGAVAFLGASGFGKSTLAAAFVNKLHMPFLADDLMPLVAQQDGIYVRPSLPVMKLWASSAERALGLEAARLPTVSPYWDKKFVRLDQPATLAHEPARLRAMYVLDRSDASASDVEIRRLAGRTALTTILAQMPVGSFLQPEEATRFLPFFARLARQAPVRALTYPGDYGRLEATCTRILEDLVEDR